jgi:hypothetical protein
MKYLYSSLKFAFFFLIAYGVTSSRLANAQDFSLDKTFGAKEQSLQVTISSSDVVFQQSTASNCPSSLKVNASGVKFTLNSGNTFSPSSIIVKNGSIVASLNIPSTITTGDYTISITGAEGTCTVTSTTKFTVKNGYVTVSPQFEYTEHIVSLTIAGFGINFEKGSPSTCPSLLKITDTTVVLKQGTTIIFANFINSTSDTLTGDFSIPANAPLGDYDLIIDYQGPCPFVSPGAFSVHPRSVTLNPATVKYGTTATVTISGNGVTFDDTFPSYCPDLLHVSATNVYFKQGSTILYPDNLLTNTSGQIVLDVTIPEDQPGGDYDVYVADDQTCSIIQTNGFTIQTPKITSISPSQSLQGTTFTMDINATSITFDQVAASICPGKLNVTATNIYLKQGTTIVNPNTLKSAGQELVQAEFTIPSNAPYGKYDVVVGDGEGCSLTLASGFTVPAPGITSVSPANANPGQTLTITINTTGVNLLNTPPSVCPANLLVKSNNITLKLGSTTIHPTSISVTGNKIDATVTVPQNADIGSYDVIVGDGETCPLTSTGAFSVSSPTITVSPNSAYVNANLMVTITGVSVTFSQSSATVCPNLLKVTNADVTFVQGVNIIHPSSVLVSGNVIKAYMNIPSYIVPGYYDVVIGQNSQCPVTLTKGFYVASPSATLDPTTASQNETLDITITGVDVNFSESSATACPSLVNVNSSNIVFSQGATTLSPASITVTNSSIVAHVVVPSNFPTGYTTLTIGSGESCPVVVSNALKIQKPTISTSVNYIDLSSGQEIIITGHGISFVENGTTTCPSIVNINTNDISLVYGSTTIHPQSASLVNGTIDAIFNTTGVPAAKYALVVGDQASCLYTASMNVGIVSGITNAQSNEDIMDIFPNPSDGSQLFLTIKKSGIYSISILDIYGKEIHSFNANGPGINNVQENLSSKLPTGIYYLKVATDNQMEVSKLIIE